MLRLDVNLSILFADLPLLSRPAAAAAAGFHAVELWWPFAEPVPAAAEVDRLVDSIAGAGLTLACLNFDGGDFAAGQRGLVSDPDLRDRFRENVPVAVEIARRLDCRVLNALHGNRRADMGPERQAEAAVDNLAHAARAASSIGATVVLEALNPVEYPRYGLPSVADGRAVAERVERETGERVGLLFDAYHVAASGEDPVAAFRREAARVAHVQLADWPGRGRPGTGRLDAPALLAAIEEAGYAGYVGLEYLASADPADTFQWLTEACAAGFVTQ